MRNILLYLANMPAPLLVGALTGLGAGGVAAVTLVRAVRRYVGWLEGLNGFLAEMGRHTRLEPALAAAAEMTARLTGAALVLIYLHDTQDGPLVLKAAWPGSVVESVPPYVDAPLWPRPPLHQAYTCCPCSLSLFDVDPALAAGEANAVLVAPVAARQNVVGYLIVAWDRPRLPATAPQTCIGVGEHLGVLVENFWMYEALRAQAARLDTTVTDLRRREQARVGLVHEILHDLRNPLQLVRGFLVVASNIPDLPAEVVRDLRIARGAAARAIDLAETLLLADVPERNRPRPETVDVAPILTEVAEQAAYAARAAGISLVVDTPTDLPLVRADRLWLYRVLDNLVLNALRHTVAGGQVTLRAARRDTAVVVQIIDTGRGMPGEELHRLLDAPLGTPPPGGRLGLWIVRRLVAGMGGELHGESRPGEGTCLYFTLPVARLRKEMSE